MESTTAIRRPSCFAEDGDGLASIADTEAEAGFSGGHPPPPPLIINRPLYYTSSKTRGSIRNLSMMMFSSSSAAGSPRSGRFNQGRTYDHEINHQPYFLDACFLCKKPLCVNKDIFMYRGDTPFCSEECRREQIESDEAKEKKWKLSASMKALRVDQENKASNSTSPNRAQDYPFRSSTVAAA